MEVGGAGGESAQDRSFDFANMVEFAIDQGLAEICRGFAVVGWQSGGGIRLAHRDVRQVTGIKPSHVYKQTCGPGIAGADVKGGWEGMIAHVGRIVARAVGSFKGKNSAGNKAPGREVVIDTRDAGDVDRPGIEDGLPTDNRRVGTRRRKLGPCFKGIEDCGVERLTSMVGRAAVRKRSAR
jgi:hypothetical protein